MKKYILLLSIIVVSGFISSPNTSQAVINYCANERLIYAQDKRGLTPGRDNDTAILNDRNGTRLLTIRQTNDNYVLWPSTVLVPVVAGDTLYYAGGGIVTFDILSANNTFIRKITYSRVLNSQTTIDQNGFLRFNQGERAKEHNVLVLCPQSTITGGYPYPTQNPVNYPPVWSQIYNQTAYVNQQLQLTVFAYDSNGDTLTYSAQNLPAGATFNPSTRIFTWTPTTSQVGLSTVVFRVTDGSNTVDMNTPINVMQNNYYYNYYPYNNYNNYPQNYYPYNYNYNNNYNYNYNSQNQPPTWNQVPNQTLNVGQTIQFTVSANDADGPYLTYSAANLPPGSTFNSVTRTFTWTPASNQVGNFSVIFNVTDGINSPVNMNAYIIVNGYSYYNNPTIISGGNNNYGVCQFTSNVPTVRAREGEVYTVTMTTNCGGNASYRVITGPSGLTISQAFGIIVWVPDFSQGRADAYPVTIGASNGGNEINQTFYIYVDNVSTGNYNSNPVVTNQVATVPVEKLRISNLGMENQNGEVFVVWQTNKSGTSRVIYDITSQRDKTTNFSYANATTEDTQLATNHRVSLGQLENNKVYYLRAVSKVGDEMAVSNELAFVKLPTGQISNLGFTASLAAIGAFLFSPWLLLILILILIILLIRSYRKRDTVAV